VAIALLITSSVDGGPPVETRVFPVMMFWTVPEMREALDHVFGSGSVSWQDWRMLLYGGGRALLWLVVISSCWSMAGYFLAFYRSAREAMRPGDAPPSAPLGEGASDDSGI
jgi:hypothetical protein